MYRSVILVFVALNLQIAGCARSSSITQNGTASNGTPAPRLHCQSSRRVVVGVDRTGSYDVAHTGLSHVAALLEHGACPGDTWLVRWIEANSYGPAAAIETFELPALTFHPPTPAGLAGRREYPGVMQRWAGQAAVFARTRAHYAGQLRSLTPQSASSSDLFGFFAKAADLLGDLPSGEEPLIILASDLEDTEGRDSAFDLSGASVVIVAFETEDPTSGVRAFWEKRLHAAHAGQILFRDPSESPDDALDLLAHAGATQ